MSVGFLGRRRGVVVLRSPKPGVFELNGENLPDTHELHKKGAPPELRLALAIVSSSRFEETRAGGVTTDKTFPVVHRVLESHPHCTLAVREVLPDDEVAIREFVREQASGPGGGVDFVVLSGGTGISARDRTVEACTPLFEKVLPGFGELFRRLSYDQIGTSTILSRATAGVVSGVPVFCIPGSPKAVELALRRVILPEVGHICYELRKE
ncbi:MAG: MogA/MoaB family molybdenum cofactor biosynthesis protein [Promethearchaeota archaeon]